MLSIPNAYAKMGLAAGMCLSIGSGLISVYTICLLVHLYEERKRRLVSPVAGGLRGTACATPELTQFRRLLKSLCMPHGCIMPVSVHTFGSQACLPALTITVTFSACKYQFVRYLSLQ